MSQNEVAKIQLRRGIQANLPGQPVSGNPTVPTTPLDVAEMALTTDTGRLFIGPDTTQTSPTQNRNTFPYQNIEILTENSSDALSRTFADQFVDTQNAYISSPFLLCLESNANDWRAVTVNGNPFYVNIGTSLGNAVLNYFIYGVDKKPLRNGQLTILDSGNTLAPIVTDRSTTQSRANVGGTSDANTTYGGVQFRVTPSITTAGAQLVLEYRNLVAAGVMYFRIERPFVGDGSGQSESININSPVSQNTSEINFFAFGAIGDGITDNSTARDEATTTMLSGYALSIPAGKFLMPNWQFTVPDGMTITIKGCGAGTTELVFTGGTGITATLGEKSGIVIEGLTLRRNDNGNIYSGTALKIVSPPDFNCGHIVTRDITMVADVARTKSWQTGIDLSDVSNANIFNTIFTAPDATTPSGNGIAIALHGSSLQSFSVNNHIIGLAAQGGHAGITVTGYVQGVFVTSAVIIGGSYGIYWLTTNDQYGELLTTQNIHIQAYRANYYLNGCSQSMLGNTLHLRFAPDSGEWCAVDMQECNNMVVSSQNIYGGGTGSEYGIRYNCNGGGGGQPSIINGCSIAALHGPAVALQGTVSQTTVIGVSSAGCLQGVANNNLLNTVVACPLNGNDTSYFSSILPKDVNGQIGTGEMPWLNVFTQTIAFGTPNNIIKPFFSSDVNGNLIYVGNSLVLNGVKTFVNDAAAAVGQIPIDGLYKLPSGALMVRGT